ncbi:MAG: hypothetical protein U0031_03830 [Thermomicrobiales bacterium]
MMAFGDDLDQWTGYFTLAGGAAATLLGLLFVAVSMRLEIFRQGPGSHVRLFASFTFSQFLIAAAIAGMALSPHENPNRLATALGITAVCGVVTALNWVRLSVAKYTADKELFHDPWRSWLTMLAAALTFAGLLVDSWLLYNRRANALSGLAILDAALLAVGTHAAWVMLSHAGQSPPPAPPGEARRPRQKPESKPAASI